MKNKIKKNHFFSNYLLILILLFCFILQVSVQGVVYVNKNAAGGANNGNSWADAYTAIQAGINDADVADEEIWVAMATYPEAIVMKSGVKLYGGFNGTEPLRSQRNWTTNVTTIDASTARGGLPAYHVVTMDSITSSTIDGFTIKGGNASGSSGIYLDERGGGIYCYYSSPAITNNTILENSALSCGGGIYCNGSSPQITNNIISGNSTYYEGGAIYCINLNRYSIIANNIITGNSAYWWGGGILCAIYSSPTITNNTISGNSANYGGGIYCGTYTSPSIINNNISENSAADGGGIYCYDSSSPVITSNIISGNSAAGDGGGIYCEDYSSPQITNNTISGNSASRGCGISCYNYSSPQITNNIISGNSVDYGWGGGIYCYYSSPQISNNTISGNSASYGGGIICIYYSHSWIMNNIFYNNNNFDIYEYDTISDPLVRYNDFYGNPDGVYYDEGTTPYTSVEAMDSAIDKCSNNIGLNPLFVGDTLSEGIWTAAPVYNSATFQTTITNSSAAWTVNEHAGHLLNPDTSQNRQFVIVSNNATTMTVWGNVTTIAKIGDTYKIFDYHLKSTSPCIDAGCLISGLTEDFEGDPRPFNGTSQIRGDGSDYDIGADEFIRQTRVDNWIFYE